MGGPVFYFLFARLSTDLPRKEKASMALTTRLNIGLPWDSYLLTTSTLLFHCSETVIRLGVRNLTWTPEMRYIDRKVIIQGPAVPQ